VTVNDELKAPNFRGVPYLYRGTAETHGFKTAEHIYPGSDNVIVEQLGLVPRKFRMAIQITFENRDAFDVALNTPGNGTLVHPLYGNFLVKVSEYTKDDRMDVLGLYDYSVEFTVEVGIITPTGGSISPSLINQDREALFESNTVFMGESLAEAQSNLNFGLNRNIVLQGIAGQTLLLLDDILGSVSRVVNVQNSDLNAEIEDLTDTLISAIAENTINQSLNDIFNVLDLVADTARDRYLVARELFGFGDDQTDIVTNQALMDSTDTINAGSQVFSCALAYDNAIAIDFGNQEELDEVIGQLDEQFNSLVNGGLIDSDTRLSLIKLRTDAMKFFGTLDLRSVFDFSTTLVPSTVLAYRLYGSTELSDQLVALNQAHNTAFIEGDIKVLSPT